MNTVKRWLAGLLSFAMIFTSSAFANVSTVYAASFDGETDKANAAVELTIGQTTTYVDTITNAINEGNKGAGKNVSIKFIDNSWLVGWDLDDVNVPMTIDFNGYSVPNAPEVTPGNKVLENGLCVQATSSKYTYATHNPTPEYVWKYNPYADGEDDLYPIWQVNSYVDTCPNCGKSEEKFIWDKPGVEDIDNYYNDELKQYEYYEYPDEEGFLDDQYLKSTMSAEGYVLVDGPEFEKDGSKIRHDADGKPVVKATILKASDGSEVKNATITLFDPTTAEMKNNIAYNADGWSYYNYDGKYEKDTAASCVKNGTKLYGVLVKDPDGKELAKKYIVDDDIAKLSHEKGILKAIEILTKPGYGFGNGIRYFEDEGELWVYARDNNDTVEKVEFVAGKGYTYWYFNRQSINDGQLDRGRMNIDLRRQVADDGSFTYRAVYKCINDTDDEEHENVEIVDKEVVVKPMDEEKSAADHQKNQEAVNKSTNPKPVMSTCENWNYDALEIGYDYYDSSLKKHGTMMFYNIRESYHGNEGPRYLTALKRDANAEAAPTHVAGEISQTTAPTCFEEGTGTSTCVICGDPMNDVPIAKLTTHSSKDGENFPGTVASLTAQDVDKDLVENHTLVKDKAGSTFSTVLTVEPTCTERGGEYLYCTNGGGHWYLKTEIPALGHKLSTTVTVAPLNEAPDEGESYWGYRPQPSAGYDEDLDYVFYALQKCDREDGTPKLIRYHSAEGTNTDTDKYGKDGVVVTLEEGGKDCVSVAKTIYSVPSLTDAKTKKPVTLEFNRDNTAGPHNVLAKKFRWSTDFEKATAIGTCTICSRENVEDEATVTQTTTKDGITTFVAKHGSLTESKKAFSLKNAVVTFDASLIKDGNLLNPVWSGVDAAQQAPDVTVTINGTVIDSKLLTYTWRYSNQRKVARVTVDWTEAVKKSGKATFVPGTKSGMAQVDAGKKFSQKAWKYDLNGVEKEFDYNSEEDEYYVAEKYSAANTYKLISDIIPDDATVKYAVLDKEVKIGNDYNDYQKRIEALTFDKDEVVVHDAGEYYVYAQITKDGYTTETLYVGAFYIIRPDVYIQIDDATCTVGEIPKLNMRVYDVDTHKVVDVDLADFTITTVGGQALDQLNAGIYELNVQAPNYNIQTLADSYMGKVTVNPKDDATVAAEKVAEQLKNAKTDADLAAAYKAFIALTAEQQKIVKADNAAAALLDKAKAASDAADKEAAAKKELDDAKTAANSALTAANAYASDATIKALIDALNAALAKNDTAAIKDATKKLNDAVAAKKAAPATKKTPSAKIKTSKKTYKAKDLKKKAKTFKIKYSKTSGSGKVTFKKMKGTSKKLKVSKSGKVTVKKGTKKGTYKLKVKMTVAANSKFNAKTVKKTIKVKVK